jgi:hypothetical protein
MTREDIAKICQQANKALCESYGDFSQKDWETAPDWQRESVLKGVDLHIKNPGLHPEDSHNSWMNEKLTKGWKYGPTKDEKTKTHPCMVPFANLPKNQQAKDHLFLHIVRALRPFLHS